MNNGTRQHRVCSPSFDQLLNFLGLIATNQAHSSVQSTNQRRMFWSRDRGLLYASLIWIVNPIVKLKFILLLNSVRDNEIKRTNNSNLNYHLVRKRSKSSYVPRSFSLQQPDQHYVLIRFLVYTPVKRIDIRIYLIDFRHITILGPLFLSGKFKSRQQATLGSRTRSYLDMSKRSQIPRNSPNHSPFRIVNT